MFRLDVIFDEKANYPVGSGRVVAVEQFAGQDFNRNASGWIKNDISSLVEASSKQQYDEIMQRLVELNPKFSVKDGQTLRSAVDSIIPRWCQSPNEINAFVERAVRSQFDTISDDAYRRALDDVNVVSASAPASAPASASASTPASTSASTPASTSV